MPASPQAHENLATVLDRLGHTDEAVAEFRSALRLKPDYAEAHYNFGNALIRAQIFRWPATSLRRPAPQAGFFRRAPDAQPPRGAAVPPVSPATVRICLRGRPAANLSHGTRAPLS